MKRNPLRSFFLFFFFVGEVEIRSRNECVRMCVLLASLQSFTLSSYSCLYAGLFVPVRLLTLLYFHCLLVQESVGFCKVDVYVLRHGPLAICMFFLCYC